MTSLVCFAWLLCCRSECWSEPGPQSATHSPDSEGPKPHLHQGAHEEGVVGADAHVAGVRGGVPGVEVVRAARHQRVPHPTRKLAESQASTTSCLDTCSGAVTSMSDHLLKRAQIKTAFSSVRAAEIWEPSVSRILHASLLIHRPALHHVWTLVQVQSPACPASCAITC